MDTPIIIDKQTYKIMRYVYHHHEVKLHKIHKKFGREGIACLSMLVSAKYALCKTPNGSYTFDVSSIDSNGSFGLVSPGNEYVENRRRSFMQWFVPTFISLLALMISVASFIS